MTESVQNSTDVDRCTLYINGLTPLAEPHKCKNILQKSPCANSQFKIRKVWWKSWNTGTYFAYMTASQYKDGVNKTAGLFSLHTPCAPSRCRRTSGPPGPDGHLTSGPRTTSVPVTAGPRTRNDQPGPEVTHIDIWILCGIIWFRQMLWMEYIPSHIPWYQNNI